MSRPPVPSAAAAPSWLGKLVGPKVAAFVAGTVTALGRRPDRGITNLALYEAAIQALPPEQRPAEIVHAALQPLEIIAQRGLDVYAKTDGMVPFIGAPTFVVQPADRLDALISSFRARGLAIGELGHDMYEIGAGERRIVVGSDTVALDHLALERGLAAGGDAALNAFADQHAQLFADYPWLAGPEMRDRLLHLARQLPYARQGTYDVRRELADASLAQALATLAEPRARSLPTGFIHFSGQEPNREVIYDPFANHFAVVKRPEIALLEPKAHAAFLAEQKIELVDPTQHAAMPELQTRLCRLVRSLATEADGPLVRVMLVDSMEPNAFYTKTADGVPAIAIHLGLLDFVESDDELAFAIGHELEHGHSRLSQIGVATSMFKIRAAENEVDTRSLIYRLARAGYNPHAAVHFLERVRGAPGTIDLSRTHSVTQSRIDTVGVAIAAMSRGAGLNQRFRVDTQHLLTDVISWARTNVIREASFSAQRSVKADQAVMGGIHSLVEKLRGLVTGADRGPVDTNGVHGGKLYSDAVEGIGMSILRSLGLRGGEVYPLSAVGAAMRMQMSEVLARTTEPQVATPAAYTAISAILDTPLSYPLSPRDSVLGAQRAALHVKSLAVATAAEQPLRDVIDRVIHSSSIESPFTPEIAGAYLRAMPQIAAHGMASGNAKETVDELARLTARRRTIIGKTQSDERKRLATMTELAGFDARAGGDWERSLWQHAAKAVCNFTDLVCLVSGAHKAEVTPDAMDAIRASVTPKVGGLITKHLEGVSTAQAAGLFVWQMANLGMDAISSRGLSAETRRAMLTKLVTAMTIPGSPEHAVVQLPREQIEAWLAVASGDLFWDDAVLDTARARALLRDIPSVASQYEAAQRDKKELQWPQMRVASALALSGVDAVARPDDALDLVQTVAPLSCHDPVDFDGLIAPEAREALIHSFVKADLPTLGPLPEIARLYGKQVTPAIDIASTHATRIFERRVAEHGGDLRAGARAFVDEARRHHWLEHRGSMLRGPDSVWRSFYDKASAALGPSYGVDTVIGACAEALAARAHDTIIGSQTPKSWAQRILDAPDRYGEHDPYNLLAAARIFHETPAHDEVYAYLRERAVGDEKLTEALLDPTLAGSPNVDASRVAMAMWQLQKRFDLAPQSLSATTVRPQIADIERVIREQFDKPSGVRDEVIDSVCEAMQTTRAETLQLAKLKTNLENYGEVSSLVLVDAGHIAQGRFGDTAVRVDALKYVTGLIATAPHLSDAKDRAMLEKLRSTFVLADTAGRAGIALSFCSSVIESGDRAVLLDLVLGNTSPIVRRMLEAYLDELPSGEQKSILAYLSAKLPETGGKTSLKAVLEAMGPLGIKAGQFLRTSGVLPESERAQLDKFFDRALKPSRDTIFKALDEAFGDNVVAIGSVGALLGSASINYVVDAWLRNPKTNQLERAVIRIQRDTARGSVENENAVLRKVIKKLETDDDVAIRNAAWLAGDALSYAYTTVIKRELNQIDERGLYPSAVTAYEQDHADRATGLRIHVAKPRDDLQTLVRPRYQDKVSVIEYIEATSWDDLTKAERQRIARQVVEAEVDALLVRGLFDADGHPGNWLIEKSTGRLVRIDYAQLTHIASSDVKALKAIIIGLSSLRPASVVSAIVDNFYALFGTNAVLPNLATVLAGIVGDKACPSHERFVERLMFIQDRLVQHYRANGMPDLQLGLRAPSMQTAFASLARTQRYVEDIGADDYQAIVARRVHWLGRFESLKRLRNATANVS